MTEWIRKCLTDEGTFEMGLEERRIQTCKDGRKRFHRRGKGEQAQNTWEDWCSEENQGSTRGSTWDREGRGEWAPQGGGGPKCEGLERGTEGERSALWMPRDHGGFGKVHLAVCREE